MKPHWLPITDAIEAAALIENGKFREDKPTYVNQPVWVLLNEQFRVWRESREGKRL